MHSFLEGSKFNSAHCLWILRNHADLIIFNLSVRRPRPIIKTQRHAHPHMAEDGNGHIGRCLHITWMQTVVVHVRTCPLDRIAFQPSHCEILASYLLFYAINTRFIRHLTVKNSICYGPNLLLFSSTLTVKVLRASAQLTKHLRAVLSFLMWLAILGPSRVCSKASLQFSINASFGNLR